MTAARVVVAGGGIAGLATALALAGQGREVLVLDRSDPPPEGPPGEVAHRWVRPLAPHAQHSHTLTSLGVRVLRERAPEVLAAAVAAGAELLDVAAALPPGAGGPADGDDELVALACRRTVLELVLHRLVRDLPGVEIRSGTRVRGLVLDAGGTRVAGVRTDRDRTAADIVVDATGRRAEARSWLAAHGVHLAADRVSDIRLMGYTRFYRRHAPGPLNRGNAAGIVGDHYVGVLHPGDGDVVSVALGVLPEDRALLGLRHPDAFDAVAALTPAVAGWLADGQEPLSGVHAMTVPPSVLGAVATASPRPVAGLFAVGDAACVTDPIFGRGMSLAIAAAFRLADVLAGYPEVGETQGKEAARVATELLAPWYRQTCVDSADRVERWRDALAGRPAPPDGSRLRLADIGRAAAHDATVWRGLTRMLMGLATPAAELERPWFTDRVRHVLATSPPTVTPGPTRTDLLAAVAARTEA